MMTETVVNVQEAPNNNAANKPPTYQGDGPLGWIKINLEYFKTTPGILKIVQLIVGILCMSLAVPWGHGGTHFFLFVATTSFIGTIIWVFIYFLGAREALSLPINWLLTEFLNTAICAVFFAVAALVQVITWAVEHSHYPNRGANIAAGVFGLINTVAYGFGAYLLHVEWKSTRPN